MLESITEFWYMWLVLAVLIVITAIVAKKAAKSMKKKNEILAKQREALERYKMLVEKYSGLTKALAEEADAEELAEGVTAVLQYELEKSGNPDAAYENAAKWRREVYALFYFDEDVTADSLSFFFKNNGGPVPSVAVNAIKELEMNTIYQTVYSMSAMYDDNNESVSIDNARIAQLDEKFSKIYDSKVFFELIKKYIIVNNA